MKRLRQNERGEVDGWMISTIGLIVLVIGAGSLAIWALLNYQEQKTNVDGKVEAAVSDARRDQSEKEYAKFAEEEKNPRREFVGPNDYGRLSFTYPKTWSVYVDKDSVDGKDYVAYLHPVVVPPVESKQQFALRVTITQKPYNEVVASYDRLIKESKVRSSTVTVKGENGVRIDGQLTNDIRGSVVIFKVRDKTVLIQTDADTFKPDFDTLIQTITYSS